MKNQPVKKFAAGSLQAAVWKREIKGGEGEAVREAYSVSFEKRYKDKEGQWQSTNFLGVDDIPRARLLLDESYRYVSLKGENGNGNGELARTG